MPRARKQVARFDPSPEAVASWNDTSGNRRAVVDLQARVRLGLSSAEAAAAAIAAAQQQAAVAAQEAAAAAERAARERRLVAGGRKRQRSGSTATAGGAGAARRSSGSKCPPLISDLRAGHNRHHGHEEDRASPRERGRAAGDASPVTDSSNSSSCSTSGSDSDFYSCASEECLPLPTPSMNAAESSNMRLSWRASPTSAAGDGSGGPAASASGTSDTDSECSSDLIPGRRVGGGSSSTTRSVGSDGGSSCSATPAGFSDVAGASIVDGDGGEISAPRGKSRGRDGDGDAGEDHPERKRRRRNVVTVRVARSQMPARWAAPPPPFATCLDDVHPEDKLGGSVENGGAACGGNDAAAAAAASILGLCEGDAVDAKNWLSSGFIDVVMAKFARTYTNVHFMPIDFAVLCLNGWGAPETNTTPPVPPPLPLTDNASRYSSDTDGEGEGGEAARTNGAAAADESMVFKDILGRPIVYAEKRPVIFLTHVNNVHWNLLRVEHEPAPELQLFEPMGKPPRRQGGSRYTRHQQQPGGGGGGGGGGTGFRCIPKEVYRWLDAVWPLRSSESTSGGGGSGGSRRKSPSPSPSHESWASRAYSAITRQQQTTGFDCGVASLLYAEKCGQGQMREDVDAWTTQSDMTEYRRALQRYVKEALRRGGQADPTPPIPSPAADPATAVPPQMAATAVEPEVVVVDSPPSSLLLPDSSPRPPAGAVPVQPSSSSAPTPRAAPE